MESEKKDLTGSGSAETPERANMIPVTDEEVPRDDSFTYDGCQVVRGEYFAHMNEPQITFNNCKVSVNTACLKRLPEIEYVQLMVNKAERFILIRPCGEDDKESFVWCAKGTKRSPKQVTARGFFVMLFELTGWNPDYRYKILGKMFRTGDEYLFRFDIDSRQEFPREVNDEGVVKTSRKPLYPAEWAASFGPSFAMHKKQMQTITFKDCTVICVQDKPNADTPRDAETATVVPTEQPENKEGS